MDFTICGAYCQLTRRGASIAEQAENLLRHHGIKPIG
jgi:hypothetical protein